MTSSGFLIIAVPSPSMGSREPSDRRTESGSGTLRRGAGPGGAATAWEEGGGGRGGGGQSVRLRDADVGGRFGGRGKGEVRVDVVWVR